MTPSPIEECITAALEKYFQDLDGETPSAVYDMVMRAVKSRCSKS